jgi:leader peptidase (prepilin peptidase)/N-methyltransferase
MDTAIPAFIFNYLAPFLIGACLGSFFNVCIYRMPLGRSIVHPGSHCSACGTPLPWTQNIPIFAWFFLRGRAACCGARLDFRYALVEILTAALFTVLWNHYPPMLAVIYCALTGALIVGSFIDLDYFILPDEITVGGIVAGFLLCFLVPEMQGTESRWQALKLSAIGAGVGFGVLWLIAIIGTLVLRKEAMGFGDVKLLGALGAFFGWPSVPFIIAASSILGSLIGGIVLLRSRRKLGIPIPFGPFIALAALIWMLGGNDWMMEYLSFLP